MKLMKYNFLNKKLKIVSIEIITFILIILLMTVTLSYKVYDKNNYKIKVIKNEDNYYGMLTLYETNINEFNPRSIIKINKETRNYHIVQITDIKGDDLSGINYQELIMEIDLKKEEKQENIYLTVTVLNNYESMFKKIIKLFT